MGQGEFLKDVAFAIEEMQRSRSGGFLGYVEGVVEVLPVEGEATSCDDIVLVQVLELVLADIQ